MTDPITSTNSDTETLRREKEYDGYTIEPSSLSDKIYPYFKLVEGRTMGHCEIEDIREAVKKLIKRIHEESDSFKSSVDSEWYMCITEDYLIEMFDDAFGEKLI